MRPRPRHSCCSAKPPSRKCERKQSIAALRSRSERDTEPGRRLRRMSAELNTGQTDGAGSPLI
jgi:hypothetical protein